MRNARLEEQAGIKIAGRNINNLRYADDTTLMAESTRAETETNRLRRWYLKPGLCWTQLSRNMPPFIQPVSQPIMLLIHTYTNCVPFMQFHKDEIY